MICARIVKDSAAVLHPTRAARRHTQTKKASRTGPPTHALPADPDRANLSIFFDFYITIERSKRHPNQILTYAWQLTPIIFFVSF